MGDHGNLLTPSPVLGESALEDQQSLTTPVAATHESKSNGNHVQLDTNLESRETPVPTSTMSTGSYGQRSQEGKVFIGGLSWETTDMKLKQYFENYGTVQEAYVSYDRHTGRPRGFGFVVFSDPLIADKVVMQQHTIDRREVEAKKALPKEESPVSKDMQAAASGQKTKKIFVGGLPASVDEQTFTQYFEKFGKVEDAVVMYDQHNRRPRGFGFITFSEEDAVESVFAKGVIHMLHDKEIEIKRAIPRESGILPSPKTLYRSPQEKHYGFRTPGSASGKGHGFRRDYHIPVHMMGIHHHPVSGMEHSPIQNEAVGMHRGIVTGIPTNIVGTVSRESSGVYTVESQGTPPMNQSQMSPISQHMMSQGLPLQQSPRGTPADGYRPINQTSMPVETSASFASVDAQRLSAGGMQNVQNTISLVSVSEALEQLSHSPARQIQQQTQRQHSPGASPSSGHDGGGTLWG